jgi:hypothetical protein
VALRSPRVRRWGRIGAATEVDGRAAYTFGRVTVSGFVRNVFDAFNQTLIISPTLATATERTRYASAARPGFSYEVSPPVRSTLRTRKQGAHPKPALPNVCKS